MASDTVLHAQIEARGCTAELWLNDVPIARIHPDRTPFESASVEEWVIPGSNRLEVLVEPGSHPSVARAETRRLDVGDATAVVRLVRFPEGVWVEPSRGHVLGEARFERPVTDTGEPVTGARTFPHAALIEVALGSANGRWAWQDAPVLALDETLVAEADAVLEEIAAAYRALDARALFKATEIQIEDVLRAYPAVDEATVRADLAASMTHLEKAAVRVYPRDPARYDFRLVAGGRLLECVDRDWTPSLKIGDPSGETCPCPVFLARLDGRLRNVR